MSLAGWIVLGVVVGVITLLIVVFALRCYKFYRIETMDWEKYKDKYERPLGPSEKSVHVMKGVCTPMLNALGITSSVLITEETINRTLKHLINSQTLLKMCIKRNQDGGLIFCKAEDDVIQNINVELRTEKDWEVVIDENRRLDIFSSESDLLWRCIFMPNSSLEVPSKSDQLAHNCVVIFIQDHAINDGVGTVELMKHFLFLLNEVLNEQDVVEVNALPPLLPEEYYLYKKYLVTSSQIAMPRFMQTLVSFKCVASLMIWIMRIFGKSDFSQHIGLVIDTNPNCERTTKVKLQTWSKEDTTKLVQACRKNGCTVQGALQAAANSAVGSLLFEHGASSPISLENHAPLDLRRRLMEDREAFQCSMFAGSMQFDIKLDENVFEKPTEDLWKLARDSTAAVRSEMDKKQFVQKSFDNYFLYALFDKYLPMVIDATRVLSTKTLMVSSFGRFDFADSPTTVVKPSGFLFSLTGGPLFSMYAATLNGQMSLSYSYFTHITDESLAQRFFDMSQNVLKRFIEGNKV